MSEVKVWVLTFDLRAESHCAGVLEVHVYLDQRAGFWFHTY